MARKLVWEIKRQIFKQNNLHDVNSKSPCSIFISCEILQICGVAVIILILRMN